MTTTSTANPDFLKIAQEHIAMGIPVMPVAAGQKAPPLICNGTKDATTNAEIVQQWWSQTPDANVAVVGKLENGGLVLLDDDEDVVGKAPLDISMTVNTRVVETSPGHRQYYFWHSQLSLLAGNLPQRAGFSLRSHNHYGMAAGSVHPDGHLYKLIVDAPIQTMPDELIVYLQELRSKAPLDVQDESGDWTLPEGRRMREGEGRNDDMLAGAGLIWDGEIDLDDFVDRLTRWCNMRHDPPYPADRIQDVAVRMMEKPAGPGLDYSYLLTKEEWDAAGVATFEKIVKQADPLSIFHSFNDFVNAPPVSFSIQHILQNKAITAFGALPGHSKTWFMLQVVRALLTGEPLFGYAQFQASKVDRVIYLVPEAGISGFRHRLHKTGLMPFVAERKLLVRTLQSPEDIQLNDPRLVQAARGAAVFLDTFIRFIEGDENESRDAKLFSNTLLKMVGGEALLAAGAHHAPKSLTSAAGLTLENVLRGSGEIGAVLDTCWGLWQLDDQTNRVYVKNCKAREFEAPRSFEIEGRPHLDETGLFKVVVEPGQSKGKPGGKAGRLGMPDSTQDVIMQLVRKGELTYEQIADQVGCSRDAVGRVARQNGIFKPRGGSSAKSKCDPPKS
jgi:Bifunctional DNA primase/polymerase, N-terminal/AAA domain